MQQIMSTQTHRSQPRTIRGTRQAIKKAAPKGQVHEQ